MPSTSVLDLSVVFIDDQSVNATIKGTDVDSDLAVIAVSLKDISEDTLSQISIAKLGNSDELKVGQGFCPTIIPEPLLEVSCL